ncbi:hypothetical protein TNCV_3630431 [Trichonephila clavipes]|nr:hypothetical protein TNCV_3630431 [Trichonephila clavipes]
MCRRIIATPPGFHRSTNRHHATQQNVNHHFRHAPHQRLVMIWDCGLFYSPDVQKGTPIQLSDPKYFKIIKQWPLQPSGHSHKLCGQSVMSSCPGDIQDPPCRVENAR